MSDSSNSQASYLEVAGLPFEQPAQQLKYGELALQKAEYWLSEPGSPLLLLIHGGCWLNQFDLTHIRPLASSLASRGIAVLSIEYRRLGDAGGGYPGTFEDVTLAAAFAAELPHDKLYVAGHSAGGQLALWIAATQAATVDGSIGLAAISNLEEYSLGSSSCQKATRRLLGGMPDQVPERYLSTSPHQLSFNTPVALIHGELDQIVAIRQSQDFCQLAACSLTTLPGLGHFDVIDPRRALPDLMAEQIKQWAAK